MSVDKHLADGTAIDPGVIWGCIHAHTRYWALATAVRLGVFDVLAQRCCTAREVAIECLANVRAIWWLLEVLVTLGVVGRDGDHYQLTPVGGRYLVSDSPVSMAGLVLHSPGVPENWLTLVSTIRGQEPNYPVDRDSGFWRSLASATFPVQRALAERTAKLLPLKDRPGALRVLDLGAGAAPWACAFLETIPSARAVVNDLPAVIDVARAHLEAAGLLERVRFLAGDYHRIAIDGEFDIVVLANVCRLEGLGLAPRLLRRVVEWLSPTGILVLADYFTDVAESGSTTATLLGLVTIANTRNGEVLTVDLCRRWLARCGLGAVRVVEPVGGSYVVLAARHLQWLGDVAMSGEDQP